MFQYFSSASTNFAGRNTLIVAPFSSLYSSGLTLLVGTSSTAAWTLPAPRIGIDAAANPSANDSRRVNSVIYLSPSLTRYRYPARPQRSVAPNRPGCSAATRAVSLRRQLPSIR